MNEALSKEYIILFQGITEAITAIEALKLHLTDLQRRAEEAFIEQNEMSEAS